MSPDAVFVAPERRLWTARNVALIVASIIAVEGFVVLHVWRLGYEPLVHYDYRVFHNLAVNLLDHATFSQEDNPPYPPSYFRGPGYPVFIALVYSIFGRNPFAVRVVQFLLLGGAAQLLYVFARRLFSDRIAGIAAILCATYSPLVFESATYNTETLATLLGIAAMIQLFDLPRRTSRSTLFAIVLGVTLGVLTFVRPSFSLFVAFACLYVLQSGAIDWGRRFRLVALLCVAYAALLVPWMIRNTIVCGRLAGPAGGSGLSIYTSAQMWAGETSFRLLLPEWVDAIHEFNRRNLEVAGALSKPGALKPGASPVAAREIAVDRSYYPDALAKMRKVPLHQYLLRALPRIYWLWSTADASPWTPGRLHRFIQGWHVFLVAFTLFGVYLSRDKLNTHLILWLMPVYLTLLHFVFHVEARYTVPARPYVWIYAAVGINQIVALLLMQRRRAHEVAFHAAS